MLKRGREVQARQGAFRPRTLPAPPLDGSSSCWRYLASLALSNPRWYSVAVATEGARSRQVSGVNEGCAGHRSVHGRVHGSVRGGWDVADSLCSRIRVLCPVCSHALPCQPQLPSSSPLLSSSLSLYPAPFQLGVFQPGRPISADSVDSPVSPHAVSFTQHAPLFFCVRAISFSMS